MIPSVLRCTVWVGRSQPSRGIEGREWITRCRIDLRRYLYTKWNVRLTFVHIYEEEKEKEKKAKLERNNITYVYI